ncbi:MDR family oxidoreductase [Aestuariivirga sp. YIM B02566]|uniref:Oxidoreductase n=1 Tax=Taklimakanibacter albus TaxID=2800327 RepID=A0ACC5RCB6_9HYPH|nr:MDR family oxidoreductase [Aestuariivirga sp. YIM B02566]MBK1870344.1 oxidoreductase [Aestuariivirga sp. YIM B02566]
MSSQFRAILVSKTEKGQKLDFVTLGEADLMPGDVTVAVEHSTVNYKDGLAVTGRAPIIRHYPLIPGIDFAGTVVESGHRLIKAGDKVILNGWGVGEGHHGGYAGLARVKGDWLVAVPDTMTTAQTMAIGTAGYTAMLCIIALERQGVKPEDGEILVTGAAGGVGSIAIAVLSKLGYKVAASTGRPEEEAFLKSLGASTIIDRNEFSGPVKALAKARFAGAVDAVGSTTLANVLSQILPEGAVAACGLAQGMDLPASVAPFILRGVKLIGINSVTAALTRRVEAWSRLAHDLDMTKLKELTSHAKLDDVAALAADIIAGKIRGRVVIDL